MRFVKEIQWNIIHRPFVYCQECVCQWTGFRVCLKRFGIWSVFHCRTIFHAFLSFKTLYIQFNVMPDNFDKSSPDFYFTLSFFFCINFFLWFNRFHARADTCQRTVNENSSLTFNKNAHIHRCHFLSFGGWKGWKKRLRIARPQTTLDSASTSAIVSLWWWSVINN